ncbi:nuclear envelope pore membrane protein POM 121C isoform X1 [Vombatus ursinus]|uniref:POM121 transmembrane nucleoporin C n=1 Tax=Vombatus ursinus TaxID=29139 RepID=A0A4X2JXR4_VOMUR|nr:nuclear envelope pore membrane protein POM 121C isoform X1 [Vombatus ursinus]
MVSSPVTVRIAPPDLPRSPPEQVVNSAVPSSSSAAPDPCAKETVMNALRESQKRAVEEEDQIFCDAQEDKRRRHDSSGSRHSAFEPLVANGAPASLVPKPGSLKRSLTSQCTEDNLNKRSRTSSTSSQTDTSPGGIPSSIRNAISRSIRNAITSSYSSTGGFSQLWKRSDASTSPLSSPASSRSPTPERPVKKARIEESHGSSCVTPVTSDKECQAEKVTDTATWRKQSSWSTPPTSGSGRKHKRKVQLLASRRGDQLTLPPPPQLGYLITAEDLDLEKKAAFQWFNKVLEEKGDPPPFSVAETSPAGTPASGATPLLDSVKKMQSSPSPATLTDPAGAASAGVPSPPKPARPPAAAGPAEPGPRAATSSSSKPLLTSSATLPVTTTSQASPAHVSSDSSPKPPPKPSILLGMLSTPPLTPTAPAAASAPPPATFMFKPIFGVPPEMERGAFLPAAPRATAPVSCGSVLPPAPSPSTSIFKPIFGSVGLPTSVPLASTSPFLKQPSSAAPTTASAATATSSGTTDSGFKPTFGFRPSSLASTTASTPATTASAAAATASAAAATDSAAAATASAAAAATTTPSLAQPFIFRAAPASGASFTPPTGSVFQFNKPAATVTAATTAAAPTTTFGAAQTVPSSTAGFAFDGTVTIASLPTTSQVTTFGPAATTTTSTAAFSNPFGSSVKTMLPPPYPGAAPQPAFGTADRQQQQQGTTKAGSISFSSTFSFGGSAAPNPALPQPTFGGLKPPTSFGTPASTQLKFGSPDMVFSFDTTTTSSFGATTQTASSGTSSSPFSNVTKAPFIFGSSTPVASSGDCRASTAVPGTSSSTVAFSFGASQSGATNATAPFGGTLNQNPLGAPSQSMPFAFSVSTTTENKPLFGGTSCVGSSFSFGTPTTPAQGFVGAGPSFGSKTPGARQRLQARRQHTRKK